MSSGDVLMLEGAADTTAAPEAEVLLLGGHQAQMSLPPPSALGWNQTASVCP